MFNLGFSVYVSNFKEIEGRLRTLGNKGDLIFTSCHISEEMNDSYVEDMKNMLKEIKKMNYKIICDVSKKTLSMFNFQDILEFKNAFEIDYLRIDYGFTLEECKKLARQTNLCFNASTVTEKEVKELLEINPEILFIHNYYPRPETGLDSETFNEMNETILKYKGNVVGFINGNEALRGPLFEGLVTLEKHRYKNPYSNFLDLVLNNGVKKVIVGDGIIDEQSYRRIKRFIEEGILTIPVNFDEDYSIFLNKVFTLRPDSPKYLKRVSESREYSTQGDLIKNKNCIERIRGSITIDNFKYKRYSSEIMICVKDYPTDEKVNVIGSIYKDYEDVLDSIKNGMKIVFEEER